MFRRARFEVSAAAGTFAATLLVMGAPAASAAAPDAPGNLVVTPADGSLLTSWSAPSAGDTPTTYTVTAYDAASAGTAVQSCSPADLTGLRCTLTSLANGATYFVSATATNDDGSSAETSPRLAVTVGGIASAPLSVSGSRLVDSIRVSWGTPSSNGGSEITGYIARAYLSADSSATVQGSCTTTSRVCTVGGLDNATDYYVSVVAVTAIREGTPSSRWLVAKPTRPTEPRAVKVARGSGFAKVTWLPPVGLTSATYRVDAYVTPAGGDVYASCMPLVTKPLQCDVGPLPNGTTYYVSVTAIHASIEGEPSSPRTPVIPAATPEPPRSVAAVQSGPEVRVSWQVPLADGGLPIESYRATAHSAATGGTVMGECTTSGDRCSIMGLEHAPVYVDVTAKTEAGTSPASEPRLKVVLVDPPGAPEAVSVSPQGRTMRISWQPPTHDGRSPIDTYTATVRTAVTDEIAGQCQVIAASVRNGAGAAGSQRRIGCPVGGLVKGAAYTVGVQAMTVAGTRASSPPVAVVLEERKPMPPGELMLLPGDDTVTAVWAIPVSDGGSRIRSYVAQVWDSEKGGKRLAECQVTAHDGDSLMSCAIGGLDNFEPYWFEVAAISAAGRGPYTARQVREPQPATPSAPLGVQLDERDGAIKVSWRAPWSDGGYEIREYVVRSYLTRPTTTMTTPSAAVPATPASVGSVVGECAVEAPGTACTLTGFSDSQHTWVEVLAVNTVGEGAPSAPIDTTLVAGVPVAPESVTARRSGKGVQVTWDAVPTSGAVGPLGYSASVWTEERSGGWVRQCTSTTETSCFISLNGTAVAKGKVPLYVSVRARNGLGWGDANAPRVEVGAAD